MTVIALFLFQWSSKHETGLEKNVVSICLNLVFNLQLRYCHWFATFKLNFGCGWETSTYEVRVFCLVISSNRVWIYKLQTINVKSKWYEIGTF